MHMQSHQFLQFLPIKMLQKKKKKKKSDFQAHVERSLAKHSDTSDLRTCA